MGGHDKVCLQKQACQQTIMQPKISLAKLWHCTQTARDFPTGSLDLDRKFVLLSQI